MASNFLQSFFSRPRKSQPRSQKQKGLLARITLAADRNVFNWQVREALYRHLSAKIGNGIPVEVALETFRIRLQRKKRVSSAKIIANAIRKMKDGSSLANALAQWVPQDEVGVIQSGELSGNIPKALELVIGAQRRIMRVNKAIKTAAIAPAVYAIAVYGTVWGIGRYVTPDLEKVLPKEQAHGIVYGLYASGDFANSWYAVIPPIVLACIVYLIIRSFPRWTGRKRIFAEQYFPYSFYRDMQGFKWLMSFSAVLAAGMPDVGIISRQIKSSSPWLRERLQSYLWRMENGVSLPKALMETGSKGMPAYGFPNPDIVDDIDSLYGFPDFPEKIAVLAQQWAEDIEVSTMEKAKIAGFWMEMAMYGVIVLLAVAINEMSAQLQSVSGMS